MALERTVRHENHFVQDIHALCKILNERHGDLHVGKGLRDNLIKLLKEVNVRSVT